LAVHPQLTVLDSPAITALFTVIRDKNTTSREFARHADRLMRILAEEGLARLSGVKEVTVETPCGEYHGLKTPPPDQIAVVSIVRAGDTLLEAVRKSYNGVSVGKILIQRDELDPKKRPKLFYSKLPPGIKDKHVILVDPMLATGGSAIKAIEVLAAAGVPPEQILFLNVVSCPEGLAALAAAYPQVRVVTAAVDDKLNDSKYIVPGLGDYGDRYYGTDQ